MSEEPRGLNPLKGAAPAVRLPLLLLSGVHPRYLGRAAGMLAVSALSAPFAARERMAFRAAVQATRVSSGPVFIVGHWRSGTTLLHNLMAQDPRFSFVSLFQAVAPGTFLTQPGLKAKLAARIPPTRPMDGVALSPDLPQEEEFAIANLCRYSVYHGLTHPGRLWRFFARYVLFEGVGDRTIRRWEKVYEGFVKKVTLDRKGLPLVLKSPVNTARMGRVLRVFPGAKFVHIVRNPFEVFASTVHMLDRLSGGMRLEPWPREEIERTVLAFYAAMMERYLADRPTLAEGRLAEVRYEDLLAAPVAVLCDVYKRLSLGDFAPAEAPVRRFLALQEGYAPNRHAFPAERVAKVRAAWGPLIARWDYAAPC